MNSMTEIRKKYFDLYLFKTNNNEVKEENKRIFDFYFKRYKGKTIIFHVCAFYLNITIFYRWWFV